ncbi:hypothetical protein [Sciscionella marina]|uniref:hypothetical protein n=1 Tax=Sciscionella marina TaxID=508770 RepID=UPI00037E81C1|nr:hypothetical protein [Sciscionella marina]
MTLDAPTEEIEALVDMGNPRLGVRQAQTHRRQNRRHHIPHFFGVVTIAGDHDQEVVRLWGPVDYADRGVMVLAGEVVRPGRSA